MKNYIIVLIILFTFAQFYPTCEAGLLNLIIRGERRLLNRNHDTNEDLNDQFPTGLQNNALNPYYPGSNNWRAPVSTLKPRDNNYVNNMFGYGSGDPNNNNVQESVGGRTFSNRNGFGEGLTGEYINNNGNINNKPIESGVLTGSSPGNREKIVNDIKRINTILEAIRKQNAENGKAPTNSNGREFPSNPIYNHPNTQPDNPFLTVHINNGTNGNKNIPSDGTPQYTLHYNKPTTKRPRTNYDKPATNPTTVKVFTSAVTDPESDDNHTPKPILSHPSTDKSTQKPIDKDTKRKEEDDKYVLKPITKRKLFVQVEPVVPDDKYIKHNETVYYIDK